MCQLKKIVTTYKLKVLFCSVEFSGLQAEEGVRAKSLQSCPALCDPTDCGLPGSSAHGVSPGKNTRVSCRAFLQGTFLTQGLNPCLL